MRLGLLVALGLFASACEDKPERNPFEPPADAPKKPPPVTETPKPAGVPTLELDNVGPKVGFERASLEQRDGRQHLADELKKNAQHFENKPVTLIVARAAKFEHVGIFLDELGKIGSKPVTIRTETRSEYPSEVAFTPERLVSGAPGCSVVAMLLEDRSTAVWKLAGGVASKRAKGMAGPDLSMTGETIVRFAKGCPESHAIFVSAAPGLEWGLTYDLAASTKTLEKAYFDGAVLVSTTPLPSTKVELIH